MEEIILNSLVESVEAFKAPLGNSYLVDDLTQRACELNGIPPVYRYLTALYDLDNKCYLASHEVIGADGKTHNLQLRFRFHPVTTDLLLEPTSLNYYYHQLLNYLINEFKLKDKNVEMVNQLIGLYVTDYVRKLIERGEKPNDESTAEALAASNLPANWKFSWWKKLIVKKDFIQSVELCYTKSQGDLTIIKCGFIEATWEMIEGSRQEFFEANIIVDGRLYPADVIVGHLPDNPAHAKEGPFLKIYQKADPGYIFPVSRMCYLIVEGDEVEVNMREEQPIKMIVSNGKVLEFAALIDGYYRMTERFTVCLCTQVQTPSIVELKKHKIHGPIGASLAAKKLTDYGNTQRSQGCYLIRQSQRSYRVYHVDIRFADGRFEFHKIIETKDGNFKLEEDSDDSAFRQIPALVTAKLSNGVKLYQLVPADKDKTGLQFCREVSQDELKDNADTEGRILRAEKFRAETPYLRCNAEQRIIKGKYDGRDVVFRVLQDESLWKTFLTKADEVQNWKSRELVPVLGIVVSPQLCLATEYMPLGSLDMYLKKFGSELSIKNLGQASLCLAKAVWDLEESGFVHGKIRCRSLFVVSRSPDGISIKLGEPGLLNYNDDDVPWIAPEYLSVMDSVAYAHKADMYALGTTMWEIFHKAKDPFDVVSYEEAREFFASNKRLPLLEVPEEFRGIIHDCWNADPDQRRPPRSIVRDIYQLLYNIYEPKKKNTYANLDGNKLLPLTTRRSSPPPLPPIRRTDQGSQDLKLLRRASVASQSSITSRKGWRMNKFFNMLFKKEKEYDTLSNISSLAPSEHTVVSEVPDDLHNDSFDENAEDEYLDHEIDDAHWFIDPRDLKIGEPLGQGFFGMVFKAELRRPDGSTEVTAAKRMKASVQEYCYKDLQREIDIMKKLRHPNIVEIRGFVEVPDMFLVMEFLSMGSLLGYLQCNREKLTHAQLIKYGHDVANAMSYLEYKRIIHRDLAARNILVESDTCVKISDFGLAHSIEDEYYFTKTPNRTLPLKWYAPEAILRGKFSMKSDVWSYGIAIWEIFSYGKDPNLIEGDSQELLVAAMLEGHRLSCPEDCPPEVYQMMRECWRLDSHLRPSFASLRKMFSQLLKSLG